MQDHNGDVQPISGAEAPHAVDPSGNVALRFTDPPGVLLQLLRPGRGTTEIAEWLAGTGLSLLFARFPQTRDLRVILDMRLMTGRSASARTLLLQAGARCVGRVGHVIVVPSTQMGDSYLPIVEAGVALARLSGLRVDIEHDVSEVLARHGIRIAIESGMRPRA